MPPIRFCSLLFLLFFFMACENASPDQSTEATVEDAPPLSAGPSISDTVVAVASDTSTLEEEMPTPMAPSSTTAGAAKPSPKPTTSAGTLSSSGSGSLGEGIGGTGEKAASITNPGTPPIGEPTDRPDIPSHDIWDGLLRKYVAADGRVDYAGLHADKAKLENYLSILAESTPQSDWSRGQAMAYWINAYNAGTVKLILDNYPLKSIRDLHGGNPWDVKWLELGGQKYSLNQIEHDILRPRYKDARIHFAVNCAAISCPPLHNRAFTGDNLTGTLERLARRFINDTKHNAIQSNRAEISKIFEWYAADFGDLTAYLNKYANTTLAPDAAINYKEYDWGLNGK